MSDRIHGCREEKLANNGFAISQPIERIEDGYAINGCCGGGCYVISGIRYCPFCGDKLP